VVRAGIPGVHIQYEAARGDGQGPGEEPGFLARPDRIA
jgi:hypothetical protein